MPGRYLPFDAVADTYDRTRALPATVVEAVVGLCAAAACLDTGGLFLDAGIGTGRFGALMAARYSGQIVGVDASLPMLERARQKSAPGALMLARADLQCLPLRARSFQGVLAVHVLHLIEGWKLVLDELRRLLIPPHGVLLLGTEQGGHSALTDHYYARARAQGLLHASLGAPGQARILALLRRGGAQTETLSLPALSWERDMPVAQTLETLSRRSYSQMWPIPDHVHAALMRDVTNFAAHHLGPLETLQTRFALSAVRWPV